MNPNEPVRLTPAALQEVVAHCTSQAPREACGYVVAIQGSPLGHRVRRMRNVDPEPERGALMDSDDVLLAYAQFDQKGEDPVIAYHSHVTSEPKMSPRDREHAVDPTLAYMIVSLEGGRPRARAYRPHLPFIGVVEHREIEIIVSEEADLAPRPPDGPWALTPGNEVRIGYVRPRDKAKDYATAVGRVTDLVDEAVHLAALSSRATPTSLGIARIRTVHVLKEGERAVALRRELRLHARHLAAAVGDGDVSSAPALAHALAVAFPADIKITVEEA